MEADVRAAMKALAEGAHPGRLPDFEVLWTRARLEAEFERRRRIEAPLTWFDAGLQSAVGLAVAFLLVWLAGDC